MLEQLLEQPSATGAGAAKCGRGSLLLKAARLFSGGLCLGLPSLVCVTKGYVCWHVVKYQKLWNSLIYVISSSDIFDKLLQSLIVKGFLIFYAVPKLFCSHVTEMEIYFSELFFYGKA